MSNFNNKSITNKGLELLSAAMAGGKLEFTRIVMGSGTYSGDIGVIESLVNQKQSLDIKSITKKGSQVILSTTLLQSVITEDFYWKEIGVYAKGDDEVEVLYMYGSATDTSFISKDMLNEKMINVGVLVSNAQNITATIDGSLVYLSRADLEAHNTSNSAHHDIREHIKSLDDNKISTSQIKNNLTETETGNVLDASQGKILADKINVLSGGLTFKTPKDVVNLTTSGLYQIYGDGTTQDGFTYTQGFLYNLNVFATTYSNSNLAVTQIITCPYYNVVEKGLYYRTFYYAGGWSAWQQTATIEQLNDRGYLTTKGIGDANLATENGLYLLGDGALNSPNSEWAFTLQTIKQQGYDNRVQIAVAFFPVGYPEIYIRISVNDSWGMWIDLSTVRKHNITLLEGLTQGQWCSNVVSKIGNTLTFRLNFYLPSNWGSGGKVAFYLPEGMRPTEVIHVFDDMGEMAFDITQSGACVLYGGVAGRQYVYNKSTVI